MVDMQEGSTSTNASGGHALADSMRESLIEALSSLRREDPPTIYKVPQTIRQVNEDAYKPKIVSIGPYHHGKERLKGMEKHKWRYLNSILSRNPNHQLEDYLDVIKELEDEARSCYSDSDNIAPQMGDEFVKMMVLDGCFIVELFLKQKLREGDPIFRTMWMMPVIGCDILLLENQIPFFILQNIFNMVVVDKEFPYSLARIALDFLDQFMPRNKEIQIMDSYAYHHLLHLVHSHLIPTPTPSEESSHLPYNPTIESISNKWKNLLMLMRSKGFLPSSNKTHLPISNNQSPTWMIPCAADLQLAGVKFRKKREWSSILDVKFSSGVLEIPPLWIDDTTNTIFRNLVTFEQCCSKATSYFTSYFWFMDCLVNTSKDVSLLHRNEIIDHGLGSDEDVAQLFNRLCTGIFHDIENSYLWDLHQNVQKHCKNKWKMWRASLKRDYFTNPWSVLSLIAASILLLLTITQTIFTVFPYYQPRT